MTVFNQSTTNNTIYFSVCAPSVFKEYEFPADNSRWTKADRDKMRELEILCDDHGASLQRSNYRRG